jgi:hypothetical protein
MQQSGQEYFLSTSGLLSQDSGRTCSQERGVHLITIQATHVDS